MLRELRGPNAGVVGAAFYDQMACLAGERNEATFLEETTENIQNAIKTDDEFNSDGTFNRLVDGNGAGPKNVGLGPKLAAILARVSFSENEDLRKIYIGIQKTIEDEFINAYGHTSLACARFEVV